MARQFYISVAVILAILSGSGAALCQGTPAVTAIVGGTLIDGTGRAPIGDAVVIVEGARIKAVGPRDSTEIPEGATVIDVIGKFIIPGLADMHNHLRPGVPGLQQPFEQVLSQALGWGITMLFNPATPFETVLQLKNESAPEGVPFARYWAAGNALRAPVGEASRFGAFLPASEMEARALIRGMVSYGIDAIKIVQDDGSTNTGKASPVYSQEMLKAIVAESHAQGVPVVCHAPQLEHAKEVLRAGCDHLVHGILDQSVDQEYLALMIKNGSSYIGTHVLYETWSSEEFEKWVDQIVQFDKRGQLAPEVIKELQDAKATEPSGRRVTVDPSVARKYAQYLPVLYDNLRVVHDAGIPIVIGTDVGVYGVVHGISLAMEMKIHVDKGFTPLEVISFATLNAAKMLKRDKDLGSIEVGKYADFLVLNSDPTADITNVLDLEWVYRDGKRFEPRDLRRGHAGRLDKE